MESTPCLIAQNQLDSSWDVHFALICWFLFNKFALDFPTSQECVCIWFGSTEGFEDCIRSEVLEVVTSRLQDQVFTRQWILAVHIPILWAFFDFVASYALMGEYEEALPLIIEGLVIWFCCSPIFVDCITSLACRYSQKATSTCWEILTNISLVLLGSALFSVFVRIPKKRLILFASNIIHRGSHSGRCFRGVFCQLDGASITITTIVVSFGLWFYAYILTQ